MTFTFENRITGEDLQFPAAWGRLCGKSLGFVRSALQILLHMWLPAFLPSLAHSSPEAARNAESLNSHILLTTDLVPEVHRSPRYFKAPMPSDCTWPPDAVAPWCSLKYSFCF